MGFWVLLASQKLRTFFIVNSLDTSCKLSLVFYKYFILFYYYYSEPVLKIILIHIRYSVQVNKWSNYPYLMLSAVHESKLARYLFLEVHNREKDILRDHYDVRSDSVLRHTLKHLKGCLHFKHCISIYTCLNCVFVYICT